jgi:DNA-binding LytR/AlgR family response regulator
MFKAIIADNDVNSVRTIKSLLAELWPDLLFCGEAKSGTQALELAKTYTPHLAFLEVRLAGSICGMQVARIIAGRCQIVFTTNDAHYAVNAFESGALDYLLKPVDGHRLKKTILRAKRQLSDSNDVSPSNRAHPADASVEQLGTRKQKFLQWICTQSGRRSKFIAANHICYFKADHKYTAIVTGEGEALINKSIKSLVNELDPTQFWRIHRSTIVNVAQIESISRSSTGRGTVRLKDRPEYLTVSRPYLHLFKKA